MIPKAGREQYFTKYGLPTGTLINYRGGGIAYVLIRPHFCDPLNSLSEELLH